MDYQPPTTKRVLMLLTNAFDPDPRVHQEARTLVENGYHVTILCWDRDRKSPPSEIIDGIEIRRISVRSTHGRGAMQTPFLFLFWLKAAVATSKRYEVVHCHDFDTLPLGYLLSKRMGAKLVYDAHESYTDMLSGLPSWMKKAIYSAENFLIKRADLLITVGEILRESFVSRGAKLTSVVGNWKDPDAFAFPRDRIEEGKKRLEITDETVICFVANLGPERKLAELVSSVKQKQDLFLVIGGTGSCQDIAERAAEESPNIAYLGYVPPSDVPFYTALSDIVFYGFDPSNPNARYSAPNKLFEALAAGKAVLTGNFGEIGRIVTETGCGLILDSFSEQRLSAGLLEVTNGRLALFKENALRAGLEKYNWRQASRTLLDYYHRLFV